MTRATIVAVSLAGLLLCPALAAAQRHPHPLYEPSIEDVGRWEAVVHYRMRDGRRATTRGRETNTVGCDGRCIESTVEGGLDAYHYNAPLSSGAGGVRRGPDQVAAGWADSVTGGGLPEFGDSLSHAWRWNQDRFGNPMKTRTSLERPSVDRRILTVYGMPDADTEILLLHVSYTRRK